MSNEIIIVILTAMAGTAVGWSWKSRRFKARLDVKCVRCGDDSRGFTLCLECYVEEEERRRKPH